MILILTDVEDGSSVDVLLLCSGILHGGFNNIATFYTTEYKIYIPITRNKKLNTKIHPILERGLQKQR